MTRFVLSSAKFHATHLIGRLTLLDKLIRMDQCANAGPLWGSSTTIRPTTSEDYSQQQQTPPTGVKDFVATMSPRIGCSSGGAKDCPHPTDHLTRRHLCSSLVFARRHLLPPSAAAAGGVGPMVVCFPHHYKLQTSAQSGVSSSQSEAHHAQQHHQHDSLYNTQLKASRVVGGSACCCSCAF